MAEIKEAIEHHRELKAAVTDLRSAYPAILNGEGLLWQPGEDVDLDEQIEFVAAAAIRLFD